MINWLPASDMKGQVPMSETVKLGVENGPVELDVYQSTIGQPGIDIRKLRATTGNVTFDPGFGNTAAARSSITYIDGAAGVLLHRGYRIEDVASKSTFLEFAYLLLYGKLPNAAELLVCDLAR